MKATGVLLAPSQLLQSIVHSGLLPGTGLFKLVGGLILIYLIRFYIIVRIRGEF